jgi:ribosomal protein L35
VATPSNTPTVQASTRSTGELTKAALGRELSMAAALELIEALPFDPSDLPATEGASSSVWIGSIGYENYRSVEDFARLLADSGVEQLVDVRELPISRRRGFAKSALAAALAEQSVEYVHLRSMGNPKEFRDLYKSGKVAEGRAGYEHLLTHERTDELRELATTIQAKRSALMCVEAEEDVCHRQVIFEALRDQVGLDLDIAQIA